MAVFEPFGDGLGAYESNIYSEETSPFLFASDSSHEHDHGVHALHVDSFLVHAHDKQGLIDDSAHVNEVHRFEDQFFATVPSHEVAHHSGLHTHAPPMLPLQEISNQPLTARQKLEYDDYSTRSAPSQYHLDSDSSSSGVSRTPSSAAYARHGNYTPQHYPPSATFAETPLAASVNAISLSSAHSPFHAASASNASPFHYRGDSGPMTPVGDEDGEPDYGVFDPVVRQAKLQRYLLKRYKRRPPGAPAVRPVYSSRKALAANKPRVRGRFAKADDPSGITDNQRTTIVPPLPPAPQASVTPRARRPPVASNVSKPPSGSAAFHSHKMSKVGASHHHRSLSQSPVSRGSPQHAQHLLPGSRPPHASPGSLQQVHGNKQQWAGNSQLMA